ncbi:thioesterase family protein [Pseudenhygromyxa sp. WMMC2535]|uniref:thioesterase family protein n=1 Tax=Pseudenhygromyxa sp. WMMC2535 TaxID=2712867 RepID=UPI001552B72B|nr:thioesterase family protein [Pseudenhygromyxa sp. WMMC2535]NVB38769.1 thioesterase family protein [Pseudenhygromyxa sp. WMMC2535]
MTEPGYFYTRERGAQGEARFFASPLTRGPWSIDHQHAGPPTALMTRAIEGLRVREDDPPFQLARISVELLRPIPLATPLEVELEVLSGGRKVQRIAAALLAGDEQLAVALAVRMRVEEIPVEVAPLPPLSEAPRSPAQSRPSEFEIFQHEVGYHTAMEMRIAAGEYGRGSLTAWLRPRVPLIADEATSPLQRLMICADAGHGVGAALDTARWSFINPELSVYLHRLPVGEWLCMDARTWTGELGMGLCRTRLLDQSGELGVVMQSQLIQRAR